MQVGKPLDLQMMLGVFVLWALCLLVTLLVFVSERSLRIVRVREQLSDADAAIFINRSQSRQMSSVSAVLNDSFRLR